MSQPKLNAITGSVHFNSYCNSSSKTNVPADNIQITKLYE